MSASTVAASRTTRRIGATRPRVSRPLPTQSATRRCGSDSAPNSGTHGRALSGFDPSALGVPSRSEVEAWRQRRDDLGQPHGDIVTGRRGGSVLVGLHDPDGIEIRLYAD